MFSSWLPWGALAAGVKIGRSRRSPRCSPAGSVMPATVPLSLYSFHADPAR